MIVLYRAWRCTVCGKVWSWEPARLDKGRPKSCCSLERELQAARAEATS